MSQITNFMIAPQTLTEAMKFSEMVSNSSFCPAQMKGKAGDVMLAMSMGAEVGLSPLQAIQNISVINGRPCLWGDGALAVAMSSPSYVSHREWFEGTIKEGNLVAYCGVTRKNSEEYIRAFSMDDAKKAKLWEKAGVWQQYPDRMLQMRARAFAIRDKFADALRGISIAEEVSDYHIPDKKTYPINKQVNNAELIEYDKKTGLIEGTKTPTIVDMNVLMDSLSIMDNAQNLDLLQEVYVKSYKKFRHFPAYIENLTECKDKNKLRLEALIPIIDTQIEEVKSTKIDESVLEGNPY